MAEGAPSGSAGHKRGGLAERVLGAELLEFMQVGLALQRLLGGLGLVLQRLRDGALQLHGWALELRTVRKSRDNKSPG